MSEPTRTFGRPYPGDLKARPVPRPLTWAAAVVVIILAAMAINALVTNQAFNWPRMWFYFSRPEVLLSVVWTLILTVAAMAIATVLALTLAVMRGSANVVLQAVSWFYIWFFRGTPVYTQLVFWGLIPALYQQLSIGIPFGPAFFTFNSDVVFTSVVCAILGLALNEAAYLAEIMRAGLNSVDRGQHEAATALGMPPRKILMRIVLPQAMRVIVPPTGNELISMLKTTSLVTAVPLTIELTSVTGDIASRLFETIPLLMVAAVWYLIITSILMVGQSYLEKYYGRGVGGTSAARTQITTGATEAGK
ncbi:amino acid ABC transporter permease [Micrococcales bacterium 31B]|nr:amino acid ABC transporter permease [Micrococcales bacterium 31B]